SITYESFPNRDLAAYLVVGEGSRFVETSAGIKTNFNWTMTNETTTTETQSRTVGYVLYDEDEGYNFSIDILDDKRWGTIGFKTVAGISSCPQEENTQKRYAAGISVENSRV